MKALPRLASLFIAAPALLLAVYAPVPEQEQGKALTLRLGAAVSHDSNIFGSPSNEIDSVIYSLTPSISFNSSLTQQTFLSLGYDLSIDHFVDRPGDKTLLSHILDARLAHQFSPDSTVDVSDSYSIVENPQSLLAGIPINTDQSFKSNQFNLRYNVAMGPKTSAVLKYRNLDFNYDSQLLSAALDRTEHLAGLELSYALLPETKLVGEYRYQKVGYDFVGFAKDKRSNYFMGGADYSPSKQLLLSGRLGLEDRTRESESDTTAPYAELSARYNYTESSYLTGGYSYSFEETSDPVRYTDSQVSRFFLNLEHQVSAMVVASGSLTWEPSQLQGRRGIAPDADETTTRMGLGLSWLPTKNWLVAATLDVDRVSSDIASREQDRTRFGVNARFTY